MRRFFVLFFALTVLSVNAQNFRVEILNSADEIKLCPLDDYIFRAVWVVEYQIPFERKTGLSLFKEK